MEHKILGISQNASIEDARRALKQIRTACHPDKLMDATLEHKRLAKNMREQAELAFERLQKKQEKQNRAVTVAPSGMFPPVFTSIDLSNAFSLLTPSAAPEFKNGIHTSTYQYSNINGVVKESGTINGRKLSKAELSNKFHSRNPL